MFPNLTIRIDEATKEQIQDAARAEGRTTTAFVLEAATRRARRVLERGPKRVASGACPSFFKALCADATRGGTAGYWGAGYELTRNLADVGPDDLEADAWQAAMGELRGAVEAEDEGAMLAWFQQWLPKCLALVPARRHDQFAAGVLACASARDAGWL